MSLSVVCFPGFNTTHARDSSPASASEIPITAASLTSG